MLEGDDESKEGLRLLPLPFLLPLLGLLCVPFQKVPRHGQRLRPPAQLSIARAVGCLWLLRVLGWDKGGLALARGVGIALHIVMAGVAVRVRAGDGVLHGGATNDSGAGADIPGGSVCMGSRGCSVDELRLRVWPPRRAHKHIAMCTYMNPPNPAK